MMELPYVDEELLKWDEDVVCYNGKPFTGVGYERHPNGAIIRETPYKNGFPHGIIREWDPTGQLIFEGECKNGKAHGRFTYWYPDGTVKSIAHYEWGVQVDYKEWDEEGRLIKDERKDPDDHLLQTMRRWYGGEEQE
jgi:antitoxin component YwqK of YwqJK toxin-antitoxin module